ncbi:MAG: DUF2203 domain-containing protein [Pirellulaceae bacterium]|jgi:hypothetical protein|nr:DUF2203 domain-containing protein [Pirellulaceae bacterium]
MNENFRSTTTVKRYTVAEANAMLPLLRSIVSDICEVFRNVTGRRVDLHRLLRQRERGSGQQYDDEVAETRADLQEEYDKIWKYREELEALGVILRQPEQGAIEFPARVSGREAYLSWQLGEEEVRYWREEDAPWTARKLISLSEQS